MLAFLVVAVAVVDRLTKALALAVPERSVAVVPRLLSLETAANVAGPFGVPLPMAISLALALTVALALGYFAATERQAIDRALVAAVVLGILSNAYDRFTLGYVVDTLRLAPGLAFNVADAAIVVGVVAVSLRRLKSYGR